MWTVIFKFLKDLIDVLYPTLFAMTILLFLISITQANFINIALWGLLTAFDFYLFYVDWKSDNPVWFKRKN